MRLGWIGSLTVLLWTGGLWAYPIKGKVGPVAPQAPQSTAGEWLPTVRGKRKTEDYAIRQLGDGGIRFGHPGFVMDVAKDGSVRFRNIWVEWIKKRPDPPLPHQGYVEEVMPDGKVPFSNRSGEGPGFSFDVTDIAMRARGEDPYYAEKLHLLNRTRPFRLKLRAHWLRRTQLAYLDNLPRQLERVWAHPRLTLGKKREILFLLWDECLEPDGTQAGRMAQQARTAILAFIQKRLPSTSRFGYTPGELSRFHRIKESRQPFDPYKKQLKLPAESPPNR